MTVVDSILHKHPQNLGFDGHWRVAGAEWPDGYLCTKPWSVLVGSEYRLAPATARWVSVVWREDLQAWEIEILNGFWWDGASFAPDLDLSFEAAAVHDALYDLLNCGKLPPECRKGADRIFRDLSLQEVRRLEQWWWTWLPWLEYAVIRRLGRPKIRHWLFRIKRRISQ